MAAIVSEQMVDRFEGWTVAESAPLLDYLFQLSAHPAHTYRHRWEPGDIICWDNRCVMHRRDAFEPGLRRLMHRTQIVGEPVQAG